MAFDILGITDVFTFVIIVALLILIIISAYVLARRYRISQESPIEEHLKEVEKLESRVKYPRKTPPRPEQSRTPGSATEAVSEPAVPDVELIRDRKDITASLRALAEKYSLSEITLATEDGLVFATSADHDVQFDAVKFSQIARHKLVPDEPDVMLFDLVHRQSRLVGIIRSGKPVPKNRKQQILDDTKVILQWWL